MKKISKRASFSPTHSPPNSDIINVKVVDPPAIMQRQVASGEQVVEAVNENDEPGKPVIFSEEKTNNGGDA